MVFISALYVGLGGFCGAVLRFLVGRLLLHHFPVAILPLGTLSVNLLGCFLIGMISSLLAGLEPHRMGLQLFLITGVLGGFTTFSAFGFELYGMLRRADYLIAVGYASLSVFGGVAFATIGWWCVTRFHTGG